MTASDPLRYFRIEARELHASLTKGVLALEEGPSPEGLQELKRHAHTLKGAARIVGAVEVSELAHALEDGLLAGAAAGRFDRGDVDGLLRRIDAIGGSLRALGIEVGDGGAAAPLVPVSAPRSARAEAAAPPEPRAEPEPAPRARGQEGDGGALRVGLGDLDALLQSLFDASTRLDGLRDHEGLDRGLRAELDRIGSELGSAVDRLRRLRLVPVEGLFPVLRRAVRDAAGALGKRVELHTRGGEHRIDGHVLELAREALLHVVRNSVDHGIEAATDRAHAGKPEVGAIRLTVERLGHRVRFTCEDDGRGMDDEAVRSAAGAVEGDDPLDLVFRPGVTTARRVSQFSGRGVGLDVVRSAARRLRGEVRASSRPGRGFTVVLTLPASLASMRVVNVEVDGIRVAVPLDDARGAVRVSKGEVVRTAEGESLVRDGEALPLRSLGAVVRLGSRRSAGAADGTIGTALVLEAGGRRFAIRVDRILGTEDAVVAPVPAIAGPVPGVAGVWFASDGSPIPVLEPASLSGLPEAPPPPAGVEAPPRPPILVIDDSLTTRQMEKGILERAGYAVETASSALEALGRAAEREFSLFIVDVEMPGMSGLEFVQRTRADERLRRTPAILVTSLGSPEDRKRGMETGARAYLVKREFDQANFLSIVASLVG